MTEIPDAERLLASSRFLQRLRRRQPQDWDSGALAEPTTPEALRRQARAAVDVAEASEAMRALRQLRERELGRVAVRDLGGLATLDETLGRLSQLADVCVQAALDFCLRDLRARYGSPRDAAGRELDAAVLGMGKLGGGELNFSSDIDLIFVHSGDGVCDGARGLPAEEFFVRLAQGVQRMLSQHTEDGFVFRVDTLLRPFGSAGPVSISVAAAERYYRTHGREWERYALVKARPVAGSLALGAALLDALRPFVYRRYLDFNAVLALRALKRLVEEDVQRRGRVDDVKLGLGGIRELEFVVQSFQLVRGGQLPQLRDRRLRPVLRWLGEEGLLSPEDAARMDRAYVYLRRLENAIQIFDDRQIHQLPVDPAARSALCAALNCPQWDALVTDYRAVSAEVHAVFMSVFAVRDGERGGGRGAEVLDWDPQAGRDALIEVFRQAGFTARPEAVADALVALRRNHARAGLSAESVERLRTLLRQMLALCLREPQPDSAAERVLVVLQAIVGRSTYLTLLHESDTARAQLARLCAASSWIARQIAASPQVLDRLLDPRTLYRAPSREEMRNTLDGRLTALPLDDVEAGMDTLRRFRQETTLRIAASDVAGELPLVQVSDRLTWLAETVVQAALERAWAGLRAVHGDAPCRDGRPAGFVAVAYGKFGGVELGYGSDLDLVFIHDCDAPDAETTGVRPISAAALLTRVGQRLIHWLSTLTPAGRAYEVDVELRPSGRSGLPVVGIDGFRHYQLEQAWTWEHQALTRARSVAGSPELGRAFEQLRRDILCRPRDPDKLRSDVLEMRGRMVRSLDRTTATRWDVKQGAGGMIDIEFITQYLLLREAAAHPEIVEWPDNWRQLDALAAAGVLRPAQRDTLIAIYRSYRAWSHASSLEDRVNLADASQFSEERAAILALWEAVFGEARGALGAAVNPT